MFEEVTNTDMYKIMRIYDLITIRITLKKGKYWQEWVDIRNLNSVFPLRMEIL